MIRVVGAIVFAACLLVPAMTSDLRATQRTAPIHHVADIQLDPNSRLLIISDVITVRGRTEFHFQLAPWLTVNSMLLNHRPIPVPARAEAWRTMLPDRGPHRIELHMRGSVPAQRSGGRGGGQTTALGPDGGYLFEGARWIPETGDEFISYRLRVEVPAHYRAVATGRLDDEQITAAAYSATFSGTYPAAPPALFVGPYKVRERQSGMIRLRTYFHRDLVNLSDVYLRNSARYLTHYQTRIGPYPYRDFHVISAPIPVGLGFPNLTYIGRRVLPLPFIRTRSLAHEILHNWWGNGITVDYSNGNWAEGLTTYMADYELAVQKGAKQGSQMLLTWLRDYAALPAIRDTPVTEFTSKHDAATQVIGYNKVAFIFHMLKCELGKSVFTKALRLFWRRQQLRTSGWMDLRRAFELASGRDLGWFFKQWLDRAGAPRLYLANVRITTRTDGGAYRLGFTVRQDQPTYRVTIPVVVETKAGLRHEKIVMDGIETSASMEMAARPLALHLDPAHDLFRRLHPGENPPILRNVTLASNVITIIATADQAVGNVALQLANRLLDTPVRLNSAEPATLKSAPLLIIGTTREIETFLARYSLDGIPDKIANRGTSRVWSAYWGDGQPLLAVAADNIKALQALLRPLPHYGKRSYLVFDGRRAIEIGTWPTKSNPLSRQLN